MDLEVRKGDLFGLVGPDGAGKTTTLQILSGVMRSSGGNCTVFGKEPHEARDKIGYVPQNCALYFDMSIDENMRYEAGLRGIADDEFRKLRDELLERMNLSEFVDRLAGQLSGGMKQKLALCCALISKPRLLLLDEPTTGLDPISRRELWQTLAGLSSEGVTAVIATPFLDEAERCNRVALVYAGKIHETGSPEELTKALKLQRVELTVSEGKGKDVALSEISALRSDNIVDLYAFGDRLEILAKDAAAAEKTVRSMLEERHLESSSVRVTAPSMENVFVQRLRELGLKELKTPPFPRIYDQKQTRQGELANSNKTKKNESIERKADIAISAKGLNKKFGNFQSVNNLNLEVAYGEIFGLLGANGAGKTTTIKMLCGLSEPTSGQVSLAGKTDNLRSRSVRKQIGYMSQKFTLYDGLTVKENLEFYASIYEIPSKFRAEKINWVLEACELGNTKNDLVGRLPRGWKQRVAFGASVMHEPKILFLDEPTAGVDPIARRQLWTLIRQFAREGTAVLVTTHYLDEAEYCNRLAFMSNSKLVAQGTPNEIKAQHTGELFELKTDTPQEAFNALQAELDPWRITIFGRALHILLDDPKHDAENVKSILKKASLNFEDLHTIPFSLEDAFINIVDGHQSGENADHQENDKRKSHE